MKRPRALATLDAALRSRTCTAGGLAHAAALQAGHRGIVAVRDLVPLASPLAESPMESEARLVMHDGGLPEPTLQYEIVDRNSRIWRVDFAWPDRRVAAEYDSVEWHGDAEALRRDRTRYQALRSSAGSLCRSWLTTCAGTPGIWSGGSEWSCCARQPDRSLLLPPSVHRSTQSAGVSRDNARPCKRGTPARRKKVRATRRSSVLCGDDMGVSAEPDPRGAPRTLLALYDEALPVVYGYFVRRCGDRGTAEDLTSDTFLAAMDAARKADPPPIGVPWLLGVARHKLADHYRRRSDRFTIPVAELPESADDIDGWDAELDRIVAESVLAQLSATHRAVLALRYMDDRSVPECADRAGPTMLGRLNGIFAFAVWDDYERRLFLARDRLGVKPLYYTQHGGLFAFASELRALLPLIGQPSFDESAIADYLTFLWVPDPKTAFSEIRKLPPDTMHGPT